MGNNSKRNAPGETSWTLDKFPEQLHDEIKIRAAQEKMFIKDFVIKVMRAALAVPFVPTVIHSAHESGKEEVRRDPKQTDSSGTGKTIRGKIRKKT